MKDRITAAAVLGRAEAAQGTADGAAHHASAPGARCIDLRMGVWLPGGSAGTAIRDHGADPASPALAGMRVLLVDDSQDTLEAFRALLELEGARATIASSAHEALEVAAREEFDLILSDIGMPGMDGYELMRELRRRPRTAATPAFALSGFGDRSYVERALASGFSAYIDKPVTLGALQRAMDRTGVAGASRE